MEDTSTCWNCNYHRVWYDEGYGSDGCTCNNMNKDNKSTHLESCFEYKIGDKELLSCPEWELDE